MLEVGVWSRNSCIKLCGSHLEPHFRSTELIGAFAWLQEPMLRLWDSG
jgi:hypothetical protein